MLHLDLPFILQTKTVFVVVSKQGMFMNRAKLCWPVSPVLKDKAVGLSFGFFHLKRINHFKNYLWKRNTELRTKKLLIITTNKT